MSMPERNTLRPVKTDRAAPTSQCDSIEITNDTTTAVRPSSMKNGSTGMSAPTAVASPVIHPSRKGDEAGSVIPSSSCTCSASIFSGSAITCVAMRWADSRSIPFAS